LIPTKIICGRFQARNWVKILTFIKIQAGQI